MYKKSLFKKFTMLVVPLVVVAAVGVALGLVYISQRAFEKNIRADYRLAAALAARQIEAFLENAIQETRAAASFVAAIRLDNWRTHMAITEFREKFPQFQYMALVDLNGYEMANSWFNQDLLDRFAWTTFQEATQGRVAYSRIVILDRVPVMFIAAPVFYDGSQVAVIWARLNAKPVWDVVIQLKRDINFGPDGHVYLLDQDKNLIASDEVSRQFGQVIELGAPPAKSDSRHLDVNELRDAKSFDTLDPETLKSLLKGWHSRPEFWVGELEGHRHIFVMAEIMGVRWNLYMIQTYSEAFQFLNQGLQASAVLVILVILTGVALTWMTAKRFLAPISRLQHGAARIARGDFSQPIEIDSQDEVAELASHFNEMQASLQNYINRLISATADLNHAKCLAVLGTTASKVNHQVGNFLNNLSLALSILKADQLSAPSRSSLSVIEDNTRQIRAFIERLLSFARRSDLTLEPWRPAAGLSRVVEAHQPQAADKHITLHLETTADPIVLVDRVLLEEAMSNLLSNAIDAAPENGRVDISVSQEGEKVRIVVEDDGPGIAPENLENVFTPFFTTKKGKGTGLGLALVQTILEAHGGEINLSSPPGKGAVALCWLPSAPTVLAEPEAIRRPVTGSSPN